MSTNQKNISFTPAKCEELRTAYRKAQDSGEDVFTFENNEYVTGYAKYLLEYLDMRFSGDQ